MLFTITLLLVNVLQNPMRSMVFDNLVATINVTIQKRYFFA